MNKRKYIYDKVNKNFLAKEVYEVLKTKIIRNVIKPGEKINVVDIAKQFGVSRSPVTNAINDLKNDSFLIVKPQVGTFVRELNENELNAIYRFRMFLEPIVIEFAIAKAEKKRLYYFKKCFCKFNEMESYSFKKIYKLFQLDIDMHSYLASCLPEIVLKNFMNIVELTKRKRLLSLELEYKKYPISYIKDKHVVIHINLIDEIIKGNVENASRLAADDAINSK